MGDGGYTLGGVHSVTDMGSWNERNPKVKGSA